MTRPQLLGAGLSSTAISRRLGRTLHRQHAGVYLHGHPTPAPGARELAATLATRGVVSDRSAAGLWELLPSWPGDVHVITAGTSVRRCVPGVLVHRRALATRDIRHLGPIPLTSPARTLKDLATTAPAFLERALNEALVRRLVIRDELTDGPPTLRSLVGVHRVTRSHAERRLLARLRTAGVPEPETNARVEGFEVDLLWPAARLVVEVDGFAAHATTARFERDPDRTLALIARAAAPA